MKGVAYETILIIGVLVAVGFSLLQLRGIFYGQQLTGKEEVVYAFAKDLESIVDKAIATTGDAAFVYYPSIKQYSIVIKNDTVTITDKVSNLSKYFSKYFILVDNSFEDCEKIFVFKKEKKILITCKCLELGEACSDSLQCCSSFCNETSGKCEEMPVCPKDRVCLGAPEAVKIGGKDCCPADKPVCDKQHCCPLDKPKWCETPSDNNPRCMGEDEYVLECKSKIPFVILTIQMNSPVPNFDSISQNCKNRWVGISPLKNCPDVVNVIAESKICPVSNECNAFSELLNCAKNWGYEGKYTRIVGIKHGSYVCLPGIMGYTLKNYEVVVTIDSNIDLVCSHEFGHTFGLCDEGYGNSLCNDCASGICNVGGLECSGIGHCCPNKPELNSIMCSVDLCNRGCSFGNQFAPSSYTHLEKELNKYCGE